MKSYVGVGESTTTAIGSTNIELTFVGEKFSHSFQVLDNLTVNIIIGVDFLCKYNAYLSHGVVSLEGAQITVPLVGRGDTSGLADLKEQVTLQLNTQRKVGLNCREVNKQPILLVDPKDRIGLICIAQENAPAADLNRPCYLTGEVHRDYPRPNGYGNKHRRYPAQRIRASLTNFPSDRNSARTQNSYSRNNSFAQNDRKTNVGNHHHQNHSNSLASEPLIEHTYDEFKVKLTNTNIYNNDGELVKLYRDVLIERLSYLLLPGSMSAELHILLEDVVV